MCVQEILFNYFLKYYGLFAWKHVLKHQRLKIITMHECIVETMHQPAALHPKV